MSKAEKKKIIIAVFAISFIQGLQYSVSPVLGQIQEHYRDVNVSLVQMLITAPALLAMLVALISGGLVVKISKKKMLIFAGITSCIAGFLPFLSDSFELLFFSRTFYGVSLGLACTLNTAVVAEFFDGDERVSVMGIQAASIGIGMVIITTLAGRLGELGFRASYFINIIGFLSFLAIAFCLPDTGKTQVTRTDKIRLNKEVFIISVFGMLEFLFLITFTTNISMHISGELSGNTTASGILIGIFSGAQIIMGLILGLVTKLTGKYTLSVAMLSFSLGGIFLIYFPDNFVLLTIGAIFCGFSQGMFIPQAMCDVSNAVNPAATTLASACFTCFMNLGQLVSPTVLNTASILIFGNVTTSHVYMISSIGMLLSAGIIAAMKAGKKHRKQLQ